MKNVPKKVTPDAEFEKIKQILSLEIEKDYQDSLKELNKVYLSDMKKIDKAKNINSLIMSAESVSYCPSNRAWNLLDKLEDQEGEEK